jgi:hypothetical protein
MSYKIYILVGRPLNGSWSKKNNFTHILLHIAFAFLLKFATSFARKFIFFYFIPHFCTHFFLFWTVFYFSICMTILLPATDFSFWDKFKFFPSLRPSSNLFTFKSLFLPNFLHEKYVKFYRLENFIKIQPNRSISCLQLSIPSTNRWIISMLSFFRSTHLIILARASIE